MENELTIDREALRHLQPDDRKRLFLSLRQLHRRQRRRVQEINIVNLDPINAINVEMMPGKITWDRSWGDAFEPPTLGE